MSISIREMKTRVQKLEREEKQLQEMDSDVAKIQSRLHELCGAFENDIQCGATWRVVEALQRQADQERGVSGDTNLAGAQSHIRAEITHLKKAIQMKEEAERKMREAQENLSRFTLS